ncbi:MAG: epoxide hydrolase family protein [Angustibacter sp.]
MNTTTPRTESLTIRPFTIDIPDAALTDLRDRLARTRYADVPDQDDWSTGTPVAHLREMVTRWQDFDWRAYETRLNQRPSYTTEIDGQQLFFQHVRSRHTEATPLLLAHTYPGSFAEFEDMIDPLTDPEAHGGRAEDAFHVVVPSLPGFPFSQPLTNGNWTHARVAATLDQLMRGLGYDTYGVHGSDAGALVARELAMVNPDGFLGAHVLQLFSFPSGDAAEFEKMTPEDYAALEFAGWFNTVNGYATMNASRPDTIAAALSDSPVGQLAYHELFDNFGNGTTLVTPDQVLQHNSLYWLTNATGAAVGYYHNERDTEQRINHGPIGVTVFASDFRSMRPFAERDNTNILSWTTRPRGGHFAAMEAPTELTEEIRAFYTTRR